MADIREIHGNIFTTTTEVLVNTVNCVGVMGAGVALECRYRFPGLFEFYEPFCLSGDLTPGKLLLYRESRPQVLCFPTKRHWKDPSKLEYVTAGLAKFAETYRDRKIRSIAFPHLGCSHGGLRWEDEVRPLVYGALADLPDLTIEIYSFDPMAADPIFDEFVMHTQGVERKTLAASIGLRLQECNKMMHAVESGRIVNMLSLQKAPGVGPKSITKVYEFIRRVRNGEGPHSQSDLGFDL